MLIDIRRNEAEFFVDALEADGAPQWMELAAELREKFGMAPWPTGSVRQPENGIENNS